MADAEAESDLLVPLAPMNGALYRQIAAQWLTGVTVVTAIGPDGSPVGLTMNAISPLSLEPPQFLVNIDLSSETLAAVRSSGSFCINFLSAAQSEICQRFARKGVDKFRGITHKIGFLGLPVIDGAIAYVECEVAEIFKSGDHAIVIGNAIHGEAGGGAPLVYFTSTFRELAPCS